MINGIIIKYKNKKNIKNKEEKFTKNITKYILMVFFLSILDMSFLESLGQSNTGQELFGIARPVSWIGLSYNLQLVLKG